MNRLEDSVDRVAAETGFSGVVRVDRGEDVQLARAYGLAHRGCHIANAIDTQFAIASGTKGLTALSVMSLIEEGQLEPATAARAVLGEDLPLIDDEVTVEQLLGHRSGIGDYVDEEADHAVTDYILPVPVHELATTEQYLRVLDGHPGNFAPDERFSYSNSGYVVLALLAERTSGIPFPELVQQRVCRPAGMHDTEFLRSDELPGRAALGYLAVDGLRTNVLHLPVRGSGDGGIYSTAADIHSMWTALVAGRIVSTDWVAEMVRPRSDVPSESMRRQWRLEVEDEVVQSGYHGVVLSVRRGTTPCVLKLTWPAERTIDEARALAAWNGRGAVLMLAADAEVGALLLERLDSTRTLESLDVYDAAEVAGRLLGRLAIPAPDGFRKLRDLAHEIADSLPARQENLANPIPERILDAARGLALELGPSTGDRLIHADLHYGNVLAGEREAWLAIDPKPVAGDPEHAVPELLWTRLDEVRDAQEIRRLLSVLVQNGELDSERARSWAIVRCVDYWLWGLENGLTEDPKRCQRILETLA